MATLYATDPKILITGVEGAGKTLFAVQQADLLLKSFEGGEPELWQINIRGADPAHLPKLPFALSDMATDADGNPVIDPETGDALPRWATLPQGSVVIVDEAHKVMPQRGPGRPPKWIEMMAEGRQAGVRFILITQSPSSLDNFLRERISRHLHLERKGGLSRATVLEFDHCVDRPQTAFAERRDAQVHFWAYPKEYYGWYTSAKAHYFKFRLPLKIWLALAFIPVAAYLGYRAYTGVGELTSGSGLGAIAAPSGADFFQPDDPVAAPASAPVQSDYDFIASFIPVDPSMPWTAPAYRDRPILAQPDILCISHGTGGLDGCQCYTEQVTKLDVPADVCRRISFDGIYNPYRQPPVLPSSSTPADPGLGGSGSAPATAAATAAAAAAIPRSGVGSSDPPASALYPLR